MKLNNKLALITGGGRGIGSAIAFAFAREGADIAVVARTASQISGIADQIKDAFGVESFSNVCDVSDVTSVHKAFSAVSERFGKGPDILVNNAGIAESAPLAKTSDELWQRIIGVNLTGTFYCTRDALPAMLQKGWGRVINIASIAGKAGGPYISAYTASKHGVIGLTRSLALEVALKGITVNAICPGYVETDMAQYAVDNIVAKTGMSEEAALNTLKQVSPQQRLVTADEVAALAVLLASEEGRGINGQGINLDGGSVLS
jgi:NAD(P)-dependent dehydrogenase (short-subunit alcohol dehydrogenase family)